MSDRQPRPPSQPRPSKNAGAESQRRGTQINVNKKSPTTSQSKSPRNEKIQEGYHESLHSLPVANSLLHDPENDGEILFARSQKVKNGEKTLLLCVDSEDGPSKANHNKNENIEIAIPDIFSITEGTRESFAAMDMGMSFMSMSGDAMDRAMMGLSPAQSMAGVGGSGGNATEGGVPRTGSGGAAVSGSSANNSNSNSNSNAPPNKSNAGAAAVVVSQKSGRRMSRAEQFSALQKSIPGLKLDRHVRQSVVAAMVDMKIWNEDDDEDEEDNDKNSSNKARKAILAAVQNKNNDKKAGKKGKGGVGEGHTSRRSSISEHDAATLTAAASAVHAASGGNLTTSMNISQSFSSAMGSFSVDLGSPSLDDADHSGLSVAMRDKIPMRKPEQIPLSEMSQQHDENIVNKAVQFLVDLNKKQEQEVQKQLEIQKQQQLQQQNLSMSVLATKPPKEVKAYTVKKFTASVVDRAIKRAKMVFKKAVDKHLAEEWRYQRKRTQVARFLSQVWRRHCSRHDVHKILAMGRAAIEAKKVAEIEEQYNYRIRMAQRRVWESSVHKEWLEEQRENPTFPMTKAVEDRVKGPIKINEEGLAMSTADEKLFAQDYAHTRPDLAPFSTKINNMISNSLHEVKRTIDKKRLIERSMELFAGQQANRANYMHSTRSRVSSVVFDDNASQQSGVNYNNHDGNSVSNRAVSSPRAPVTPMHTKSPRTSAMRTPRSSGYNSSMHATAKSFDFPATPMSLPFPSSVSTSNTPYSKAMLNKMRLEDASDSMVSLTLPQRVLDRSISSVRQASLVGWEEMARLDNIPTVEEIKKNANTKSAAYKVLERLCGLSEEDVMRSKLERLKEGKEEVSLANSKFLSI